jgi:murein DD-endopeptidase MepM/ murein hydrolase activator NlpD
MSYILYLNFYIINLQNDKQAKDDLYTIQINNRINEINLLNDQLTDLQKLLNIGLDLSNNNLVYTDNKLEINEKNHLLTSIPSGSPLLKTFITSKFGYRIHPIAKTRKLHTGTDFRARVGTNIYAPADGIVLNARNYDGGGYGKMVVIAHNYGFKTLFGHMSNVDVKKGDFISKGTIIGRSGNTGTSTAPHLHYEIKFLEKYVDPINFVYWNNKTFDNIFNIKTEVKWEELLNLTKKRQNNF